MSNRDAKPAAALIGGSAAIFLIGFLQFITEAAPGIKPFLTLNAGIGPLSGKIFVGYLIGLVVFFAAGRILEKKRDINTTRYYRVLIIALVLASLLSLVPFTDFLLGA